MTDYEVHAQWLIHNDCVDYFFVAHEGMTNDLLKFGIDQEKIFETGIPLSNRFLANYDKESVLKEFGLELNKTTILFFGGGEHGFGKDKTYTLLHSILKSFPNIQVVAIAGRNEKVKSKFEKIVSETNSEESSRVLSYTTKVPELMSVSDLVITKPGGLTTTESLASGLPMILINPIPGQEKANADFLEENGIGITLGKNDNIEEKLNYILNKPDQIKKMKINARLAAKRNSTIDICSILLQ